MATKPKNGSAIGAPSSLKPSELMMDLLKELALLKEQDTGDSDEFQLREKRRREITEQIKALGESQSEKPLGDPEPA
jgi:hypothetical protein